MKIDERTTRIWEIFNDKANEFGYTIRTYNDSIMGIGTTAFQQEDKYIPIILFKIGYKEVSIMVQDRNGDAILMGDLCACYKLKDVDSEDYEQKFAEMCDYAINKWSKYSKDNRLDFVFNNLEQERIDWDNK